MCINCEKYRNAGQFNFCPNCGERLKSENVNICDFCNELFTVLNISNHMLPACSSSRITSMPVLYKGNPFVIEVKSVDEYPIAYKDFPSYVGDFFRQYR